MRLRRVFKSAPTTFHYFQTSYFTITFYYPFYPPPTFPFLPSLQKQRTLPNSRRGGGLPRPLPRFSPLSQTPPTPPSPPTPALSLAPHYQKSKFAPQVKQGCFNSGRTKSLHGRSDTNDRRRNHNSSFFILHFSSFILTHHRQPRTIPRPRTTPIQNPPPTAVTTIIHFSFFIIHHSLSSPPTPPFPPSLPLRARPRPAPPQFQIRAIGAIILK